MEKPETDSSTRQGTSTHPAILDDQAADQDLLGFTSYADALTAMLLQPRTRTPITVGIYGRWGTGKTTLMRIIERKLRRAGVLPIWFNAWQYSREDELWAAFLQSVLNGIYRGTGTQRIRFTLRLIKRRANWSTLAADAPRYAVRTAAWVIPALLTVVLSGLDRLGPSMPVLTYSAGATTAIAFLVGSAIPLVKGARELSSLDLSSLMKANDYREKIGFLDQFREHFADVVSCLDGSDGKKLAVIIDDLDRCAPERTLQVLDAINLFLNVPGTVYIVGLDTEVVARALAAKYKDDDLAQREYLSKIVQIAFQLPRLTRETMTVFLEQILVALPDERCRSVFTHGLRTNPRELKRTINTFSLLWYLVQQRDDIRPLINPVRLAKLVVLQHTFPRLFSLLSERPELLIDLESFCVGIESVDQGASTARTPLPPALEAYSKDDDLRRVMLQHLKDGNAPGSTPYGGFRGLSHDTLAAYFTFTLSAAVDTPSVVQPGIAASTGASTVTMPLRLASFRLINEIGRGGMAVVYLGEHITSHERVAIKVLDQRTGLSDGIRARFQREISIIRRLEHPNIVRFITEGEFNTGGASRPFFVMEFLGGGTLAAVLRKQGRLHWREARDLLLPILDAVQYLHELGIVHRDIKADSIGLDDKSEPRLMDFGIGMQSNEELHLTQTGVIIGTPSYIAPEALQGHAVSASSDLFSIGVVLYESLTGTRPFDGVSLAELMYQIVSVDPVEVTTLVPDIPRALSRVVRKCLEKDPKDRYQSAKLLHDALASIRPVDHPYIGG